MADFTEDEKAAIRSYLGWSALYYLIDPRLESQIGTGGLGTTQPSSATRVRSILTRLADIDSRLDSALDNLDLTKAEDINFLGSEQLDALRNQGRMLVGQLAIIFEVVPKRDYFDEGGGTGMGGLISLG
jgi:hypothetical protein